MEFLNNILCLTYDEFVPSIAKADTYKKLKQRGKLLAHGKGGNGRKVLIELETLPEKYVLLIKEHYGDPYEYVATQPILDALQHAHEAEAFYHAYLLPNGDLLTAQSEDFKGNAQINYVERYTTCVTWLNMLAHLTKDKRTLKRELGITVEVFWQKVIMLLKTHKVALPKNAKRLKQKIKEHTPDNEGYERLIELHKFGNNYSQKVDEEQLKAYLKLRNRHDNATIAIDYNIWALDQIPPLQEITPAAVSYWRNKWKTYLIGFYEGKGALKSAVQKKIHRERVADPLTFINSDDNVLDLFWNKPESTYVRNGKTLASPASKWFKITLYVIWDTYNDLPLGYAAGHSVTIELVKDAYRDAARYVKKMTGNHYMWQQIQTDRWALDNKQEGELGTFYRSMATSAPAQLKNPFSKYVERSFGTVWHQHLKRLFPKNYSGYNITAKQKLNRDDFNPKNFPHIDEAPRMVADFIQSIRNSKRKGKEVSREQEWITQFEASDLSKKKLYSAAKHLEVLGQKHLPKNGHRNSVTDQGIPVTFNGERRFYELSQAQILKHIGETVEVSYDPLDLSQILITNGKGWRYVAPEWKKTKAAFAYYEEGDGARIKTLQEEGKSLIPMIAEWAGDENGLLLAAAEARIQAGVMTKEVAHEDQKAINAAMSGAVEVRPIEAETIEPDTEQPEIEEKKIDIYDMM